MSIHAIHYSEVNDFGDGPEEGDLVDISYQCSYSCMLAELMRESGLSGVDLPDGRAGIVIPAGSDTAYSYGGFPCGSETDYDVYCGNCGSHLWHGLGCWQDHDDPSEIVKSSDGTHGGQFACGSYDWVQPEHERTVA
jgi:hypothetical protein